MFIANFQCLSETANKDKVCALFFEELFVMDFILSYFDDQSTSFKNISGIYPDFIKNIIV